MAIIHAPGVCRYTVKGMIADRPWANIIDMEIDTSLGFGPRNDAIFTTAGDILNNWVDHMMPGLVPEMSFTEISWVDLHTIDGTTGSRSATSEYTLPVTGDSASDFNAGSIAYLYTKELVGAARNARTGRMYVAGPGTVGIEDNMIQPNTLSDRQDDADTFLANITDEGAIYSYTVDMCVVHTPGISGYGPGDVYEATSTHVSRLALQPRLATQRRRLRG